MTTLLGICASVVTTVVTLRVVFPLQTRLNRDESERQALRAYKAHLQAIRLMAPAGKNEQLWRPTTKALQDLDLGESTVEFFGRFTQADHNGHSLWRAQLAGWLLDQLKADLGLLVDARKSIHFVQDADVRMILVGAEAQARNVLRVLEGIVAAESNPDTATDDVVEFPNPERLLEETDRNLIRSFEALEEVCTVALNAVCTELGEEPGLPLLSTDDETSLAQDCASRTNESHALAS